jgi:hypothetical protein
VAPTLAVYSTPTTIDDRRYMRERERERERDVTLDCVTPRCARGVRDWRYTNIPTSINTQKEREREREREKRQNTLLEPTRRCRLAI